MKNQAILLSLLASMTASGCKAIECGDGTIERDGICQPPDKVTDPARCGPFTEIQGDTCVPQFPPTECDPVTTAPTIDEETGVTICIGTTTPDCNAPIACPTPTSSSRMTICGQLYDFETNAKFQAASPSGAQCNPATPEADGPCSLFIAAYNAVDFAGAPTTTTPLPNTDLYIDNCGRFRISNIDTAAAGPFTGLGVDDIADMGPTGVTITAAVATATKPMTAVKALEAFIVKPATAAKWSPSVSLQTGVYAPIYRQHKLGNGDPFANQTGVEVAKNGSNTGVTDFYFPAAATDRGALDTGANATGANGTALVTNAKLTDGNLAYGGIGGLGQGCTYEPHAGASLPGIVFIQVFRKIDKVAETCND